MDHYNVQEKGGPKCIIPRGTPEWPNISVTKGGAMLVSTVAAKGLAWPNIMIRGNT